MAAFQCSLSHVPCQDMRVITKNMMLCSRKSEKARYHCARVRELIGEIARRVEAGEVLYVHCWGGRGRAGTVAACLLASLYGVDAEQALARVQRAYDTRGELGACAYLLSLPPCNISV